MASRTIHRALVATGIGTSALVACSLGLDPNKLKGANGSSLDATTDAPTSDVVVPPGDKACRRKEDCPPIGCYEGECLQEVCKYELCPTLQSCSHKACIDGKSCAEPPISHTFSAAHTILGRTGVGCNGSLGACVTVVYPFAFVGHKGADPVAYPIVDFTVVDAGEPKPPDPVTITGLQFTITRAIASGRRVWFIGQGQDRGSERIVNVAWVDVPSNPGVKNLQANVVAVQVPSGQDSAIGAVFAGGDQGIIATLAQDIRRAAQLRVDPATGTIDARPSFAPLGAWDAGIPIVASSGWRLVTARVAASPPGAKYQLDIIANAGASNASLLGEQDLALTINEIYPEVWFNSTPQGGVVAQAAVAKVDDGGLLGFEGLRVAWVIQKGDQPNRAANPQVDLGVKYLDPDSGAMFLTPPPGTLGPLAAVGEDRVIALQATDGGSAVRGVNKAGAMVDPGSIATLPLSPGSYVLHGAITEATNKAYAYAFSSAGDGEGVRVQIFEMGCGQ